MKLGSFGEVVLATHKITGDEFALKKVKKNEYEKKDWVVIMNEINLIKKLDHPNIMKIY
jgi:calcium-dependent protein kinase